MSDRLLIPEAYLCVCKAGHLTAPGYVGQKFDPPPHEGIPRMCPRTMDETQHGIRWRAVLCASAVVRVADYPLLLAAYKLGGEDAVAALIATNDVDIDWPAPAPIITIHGRI